MNEAGPTARIDRMTVALAVTATVLAAALILVVFTGSEGEPDITAPSVTTSTPTSTSVLTTVEVTAGESTEGPGFVMPPTFLGRWVSTDGAVTASFSETQLLSLDAELSSAPLDGRLALARSAALDRVPTEATPSSSVLTLGLELNGVAKTIDAIAVFTPTDECLSVEIDLDVDLSDFDLVGDAVRVPVVLCLLPGS